VPESQNPKWSVSQPGVEYLRHCPHFGTLGKNGLIITIVIIINDIVMVMTISLQQQER